MLLRDIYSVSLSRHGSHALLSAYIGFVVLLAGVVFVITPVQVAMATGNDPSDPDPEGGPGPGGDGSGGGGNGPEGGGPDDDDDCDECTNDSGGSLSQSSTCDPIYLRYGSVLERATDLRLSSPGGFSWAMSRSYDSSLEGDTTLGNRWMTASNDMRLLLEDVDLTGFDEMTQEGVVIVKGALLENAASQYKFEVTLDTSDLVIPVINLDDGTSLQLTYDDAGTPEEFEDDEFVLQDRISDLRITFYGPLAGADLAGRLKERSTRTWHFNDGSGVKKGFEYSYTAGQLTTITSPTGQDYEVSFGYDGNLLTSVTVKDESENLLEKVEYFHYDDEEMSSDVGSEGDLVLIKVSRRATGDTGGTLSIVRYAHYRYDENSRVTAVFRQDAIQRAILDGSNDIESVEDLLNADDEDAAEYASRRFEYYIGNEAIPPVTSFSDPATENLASKYGGTLSAPAGWAMSETLGGCGSCGDGTQRMEYYYLTVDDTTTDQNVVAYLVVEDTIGENGTPAYRKIYGLNSTGRLLRKAFIEDPIGSPSYWCESWTLKTDGKQHRVAERRLPSAHTAVINDSLLERFLAPYDGDDWDEDDTLNDDTGLIYVYEYDPNPVVSMETNNAYGMKIGELVKEGRNGTPHYIAAWDYNLQAQLTASYEYFEPTATRGNGKATTHAYTYYDLDDRLIKTKTTTRPVVSTGQNGSGSATTTEEYYDTFGRLRWTKDGEGYVNYYSYHPIFGGMAYMVQDVDPGFSPESGEWDGLSVGNAGDNKPTRGSGLPTALGITNKTYYDVLDRVSHRIDPGGSTHYTLYKNNETIELPYWDGTETLLPIQVTYRFDGSNVSEQYQLRAGFSVTKSGSEPVAIAVPSTSDYVSLTLQSYDLVTGQLLTTDRYHTLPPTLPGTLGDYFYRTTLEYDFLGRVETIAQYVSEDVDQFQKSTYDVRGRVVETHKWVTANTPQLISKVIYDHGGVGDGHITQQRSYFDDGADDYTGAKLHSDFRGRRRGVEPIYGSSGSPVSIGPYQLQDLNWQGQPVAVAIYDTAPSWIGDTSTTTDRRKLHQTLYDDLGRPYRTIQHKINASSGNSLGQLVTDTYYDRNDNPVAMAEAFGAAREMAYDGAGRQYQTRTVIKLSSATPYSSSKFVYNAPLPDPTFSAMSGGNAGVLTLEHSEFDSGSNLLATYSLENNHDDATGGSAGITLGSGSDYVQQTVYNFYDEADRLLKVINYGSGDTAGGAGAWKHATTPARPNPTTINASTNLLRLLQYAYHTETGRQNRITDPLGTETFLDFDALGRTRYLVENFVDFSPSAGTGAGGGASNDQDRVVGFTYNGLDKTVALVAYNVHGMASAMQVTGYLYEDPVHADLVTSEVYPDSTDTDSSGSDQIKLEYAFDRLPVNRTDQRGTIRQFTYNNRRQLVLDAATTLGGSTDSFVQSLKREYDDLARITTVTSYAASSGTGTVRNQVQLTYNELDQVVTSQQAHSGAVGMGTPSVQYAYDDATDGNIFEYQHRLQSVTYPNGRVVFYDYNKSSADSPANRLSRLHAIRDTNSTGTIWTDYAYNGTQRLAAAAYPQIDLELDYFQGTAGTYAGYDRFGQVKDQFWDGTGSTPDADRFAYTRDFMGSPTQVTRTAASRTIHQANQYDELSRIKSSFGYSTPLNVVPSRIHAWSLDSLGNWREFDDSNPALEQVRDVNNANEITDITETVGAAWTTPLYDAAGNMTRLTPDLPSGQPGTAVYDAWNRLRQIVLTGFPLPIVRYEYDGLNRRTVANPTPLVTATLNNQYFYYNENWQELEVRGESSTDVQGANPLEQFVWHPYYIDALATRFYDADIDGIDVEQHYFVHDANYNVTAAVDDTGAVVERYHYSAYGEISYRNPDFTAIGSGNSTIGNHTTYTGRRRDTESGLYHYRNRYYHPQLGKFLTRDPIGYEGSPWNLYEYVGGRPVTETDPSGMGVTITLDCGLVSSRRSGVWRYCTYRCVEDTTVDRKTTNKGGTFDNDLPSPIVETITNTIACWSTCPGVLRKEDYKYTSNNPPLTDCSRAKCISEFNDAASKWKKSCRGLLEPNLVSTCNRAASVWLQTVLPSCSWCRRP